MDDGGCSGFQYNFDMVQRSDMKEESDYIFNENGASIYVDNITMDFI